MDKDTFDIMLSFAGCSVGIALFVGFFWWQDACAKSILQNWAVAHGFRITQINQRLIFTGAFKWWTISSNQYVYFFKVRDREGHERSGWARCGSYFGGVLLSDKIKVRWDEP
jgi:hypothetical protein